MGCDGVILWGSSSDIDNKAPGVPPLCTLCQRIQTYLEADAGPAMMACVDDRQRCRAAVCSGHGNCADFDPTDPIGGCKAGRPHAGATCICDTGFAGAKCESVAEGGI